MRSVLRAARTLGQQNCGTGKRASIRPIMSKRIRFRSLGLRIRSECTGSRSQPDPDPAFRFGAEGNYGQTVLRA